MGQDVASQTQTWDEQRWPGTQAVFEPHLHAPPEQLSPLVPQLVQAPPPVPQVEVDGLLQVDPVQQPFGHDVGSHVQLPLTQCCPVPHGAPVPQWQAPPAQVSAAIPQFEH